MTGDGHRQSTLARRHAPAPRHAPSPPRGSSELVEDEDHGGGVVGLPRLQRGQRCAHALLHQLVRSVRRGPALGWRAGAEDGWACGAGALCGQAGTSREAGAGSDAALPPCRWLARAPLAAPLPRP